MYLEEDSLEEIIEQIIKLNESIRKFWTSAKGWAPIEAVHILSRSRLDWQVSLSKTLKLWIQKSSSNNEEGRLILAWTNLGSLVEGTLKLYFSAHYEEYKEEFEIYREELKVLEDRNGNLIEPDTLALEKLKQLFNKRIRIEDSVWDQETSDFIEKIQQRRNAIHAYKNRDIGSFDDFYESVRNYLKFLRNINGRLPYPQEPDIYDYDFPF